MSSKDLSIILLDSLSNVLGSELAKLIDIDYVLSILSPEGDQFVDLTPDSLSLLAPLLIDLQIETKKAESLFNKIIMEGRKQILLAEMTSAASESSSEDASNQEYQECGPKENYEPYFKEFMEETWSRDPLIRRRALREICPCKIKANVEQFWRRIIEMANDEDENVRYQVLHNLCDGSPNIMEDEVVQVIEKLHNDSNKKIKRQTRRVLTNYRRTGKWNIL